MQRGWQLTMLVSKQKLFAAMSVPTQKVLVQRLSAATVRVRRRAR